jgi:hypothetical protein
MSAPTCPGVSSYVLRIEAPCRGFWVPLRGRLQNVVGYNDFLGG